MIFIFKRIIYFIAPALFYADSQFCQAGPIATEQGLQDPLVGVFIPQPASANRNITESDFTILSVSRDRDVLKDTALLFASSALDRNLQTLANHLVSAEFFERLDSPEDYQRTYRDLRLSVVIKSLALNRCPSAQRILIGLINSSDYQKHILRIQLLVHALAIAKPTPVTVVSYWDKLSNPESPIAFDVVESICINQSKPAMILMEGKFADSHYEERQKLAWMRQLFLPHRYDEALLLSGERLLTNSLPQNLCPSLVEVIFDYKPGWYVGDDPPQPPALNTISLTAKEVLQRIGYYALQNVDLNSEQKAKVSSVLEQLRRKY